MARTNYTTVIAADKTAEQLRKILVAAKVQDLSFKYDAEGLPEAVSFRLLQRDPSGKSTVLPFPFVYKANWRGVQGTLKRERVVKRLQTKDQAIRVAWRTILYLIEAQIAYAQDNEVSMAELMLPAATGGDGQTLAEAFAARGPQMLGYNPS